MRSSKSRSRSKSNRPRTMGNIVNRVFDSSGPEGKVRGTPQQIIEKYLFLARDAQLSNDRVAAENFLQHAEHYTRMLGEAQRELAAEQEARQQAQQANGQNGQHQRDRSDRGERGDTRPEMREERDPGQGEQPYIRDESAFLAGSVAEESSLVETPESRPRQSDQRGAPRGERRPDRGERGEGRRDFRQRRDEGDASAKPTPRTDAVKAEPAQTEAAEPAPVQAPAVQAPAPEAPAARKPRAARKPKAEKPNGDGPSPTDGKPEAAE